MKIAFDVDVLAKQMDINRMVHQVADWGYKYIEQSPHPRINPFYKHPFFQRNVRRNTKRHSGNRSGDFLLYRCLSLVRTDRRTKKNGSRKLEEND